MACFPQLRGKPELPFRNNILRSCEMDVIETLFQVPVNVGDVICQRSVDGFVVFRGVEYLLVQIPISKSLFETVVKLCPLFVAQSRLGGRHVVG